MTDSDIKNFKEWSEGNKYLFNLLCSCSKNGINTFASCGGHEMPKKLDSEVNPPYGDWESFPYIGIIANSKSLPFIKDIIFELKDMKDIEMRCSLRSKNGEEFGNEENAVDFCIYAHNTNCCEVFSRINSAIENHSKNIRDDNKKGNIFSRLYNTIKAKQFYKNIEKSLNSNREANLDNQPDYYILDMRTKDMLEYEKEKGDILLRERLPFSKKTIKHYDELYKKYGYLQKEYIPYNKEQPIDLLDETKKEDGKNTMDKYILKGKELEEYNENIKNNVSVVSKNSFNKENEEEKG